MRFLSHHHYFEARIESVYLIDEQEDKVTYIELLDRNKVETARPKCLFCKIFSIKMKIIF